MAHSASFGSDRALTFYVLELDLWDWLCQFKKYQECLTRC